MFWYHPHHHGMVADQIFGGLYGAIIVDKPAGESGSIPITRERVLVISDISLNASGGIRPPSAMARMRGREGDLVLVNGSLLPPWKRIRGSGSVGASSTLAPHATCGYAWTVND